MTGSEKILESIKADSTHNIQLIVDETNKKVLAIKEQALSEANTQVSLISNKADIQAQQMYKAAKSSAVLAEKNAVLSKKREEINKSVEAIVNYLVSLSDEEYFSVLYKIAGKMDASEGEIALNKKDLERLPSDFSQKMKLAGINATISKEPQDIVGGFILKCGKIELSADFSAMVSEKRDELEDFINSRLFAE